MDADVSVCRITELPTDLGVLIELSHKEAFEAFGAVGVLRDQWLDGSMARTASVAQARLS